MTTAAIILAGGSASRMGGGSNKPYRQARGKPLLWYSITAFRIAGVDHLVVVARPEEWASVPGDGTRVVAGGATRTGSEHAGLAALEDVQVDMIMIHDAARPFVTPELIDRVRTAARAGGALPVLDPEGPLWTRQGANLIPAPDVVRAQTPQAFLADPLRAAYQKAAAAGFTGADTAEVVQRFGTLEVAAVAGDQLAFKVTYQSDMDRVDEAAAAWTRIVQRPPGI